jgi:clathrin heavy chain
VFKITTSFPIANTDLMSFASAGATDPVKVFDRHATLSDCQIINYRVDNSQKWLCVVGIAQREGRIAGAMQLYSVEKKVSQAIEGHAAAFGNFTVDGATSPSIIFAFAKRTATEAKVRVHALLCVLCSFVCDPHPLYTRGDTY